MDAADLQQDYDAKIGRYKSFGPVAESILREVLRASGIQVHSVSHRAKEKPSALKKATRDGNILPNIDSVHDLLGLRVVTYFADQVDQVGQEIERNFDVDEQHSVDKRDLLDPDRFGYLSLHFVASLTDARTALPEYASYEGLRVEIQIRSILQHAWAEIEHDLGYKSSQAIPQPLRRRFSRLAGLLELADDEFKSIRNSAVQYAVDVARTVQVGGDAEINQESLLAFIEENAAMKALDAFIAEAISTPLVQTTSDYAGARATELTGLNYATLSELSTAVDRLAPVIKSVAPQWLSRTTPTWRHRWQDEFNGASPTLTRGVGLFYLYLVRMALETNVYAIADEYDEAETEAVFVDLCRGAAAALLE